MRFMPRNGWSKRLRLFLLVGLSLGVMACYWSAMLLGGWWGGGAKGEAG